MMQICKFSWHVNGNLDVNISDKGELGRRVKKFQVRRGGGGERSLMVLKITFLIPKIFSLPSINNNDPIGSIVASIGYSNLCVNEFEALH